jgi:HlyD family secretion protein
MGRYSRYGILCLFVVGLMIGPALADATPAKKAEPAKSTEAAKPAPATQTVKKGLLKITLELDGVFEGETAQEIAVRPDEWMSLVVLRVAPHGAVVRKGDVVLELETEKLDRAIADAAADLDITRLGLQQTEEQVKTLEKTTPLDFEAGKRAAQVAEEDQRYYLEVERPFTLKSAEFSLRATKEALEYQEEELRQLEKMYKADDITEETEAIVLRRGRNAVDSARFSLVSAQLTYDHTMKYAIPRRDVAVKEGTARKLLDWERAKATIPMELQRQRLELQKLRMQRAQAEERMKRLQADRKAMTVRAPIDGIVFYGRVMRGRATDSAAMADMLRPGGVIPQANQIVMTVVQSRPMFIHATASEGNLNDLRPNLPGIATTAAYPDLRLPATLDSTSDVPISPGTFDARLNVDLKGKTKLLVPGMSCKVKLTPYLKRDAITVPPSAVVDDELDEEKHTVQILEADGTTKSRPVTIGRKTDKQVEILTGLKEGDKVVIEPAKK